MDHEGPSLSHTADEWNQLWQAEQAHRATHKSVGQWNQRAATFDKPDTPDDYVNEFLRHAHIHEGETIFDMGCGTGGLALPLAEAGHRVLAADFSPGMLERLQKKASLLGVRTVQALELSWADDWEAKGIHRASWDVCIASRSLITDDMLGCLRKLSATARRRVCVTIGADCMPRVDERIIPLIGLDVQPCHDDRFVIGMIEALGYRPEISRINTERPMRFADRGEALKRYLDMVAIALGPRTDALTASEWSRIESQLRSWLDSNLISMPDPAMPNAVRLREPRITTWAFIGWDVRDQV